MSFADWLVTRVSKRPPDLQIGGPENPYLNRWYLIPRNPLFNIYLHQFIRDDDDRAFHDHPWLSLSCLLRGILIERSAQGDTVIEPGDWTFRTPRFAHRLEIPRTQQSKTWTLFLTGPRIRDWGFHCPQGWVHWRDFTTGKNGELVGVGCGEQ